MQPIKQLPSPNHSSRNGHKIEGVVIHVTEGSIASVDDWFSQPVSKVSAHYCILKGGGIHQYVDDSLAAWHAGRVLHPSAQIVLDHPGVNPNAFLLGVEHEGSGKEDFTPEQYETSSSLLAYLSLKYDFPLDNDHVVGHHTIFAGKTCPGPADVEKLIRLAKGRLRPTPGEERWSEYLGANVTLVDFKSDTDWTFTFSGKGTFQAGGRWSMMGLPR